MDLVLGLLVLDHGLILTDEELLIKDLNIVLLIIDTELLPEIVFPNGIRFDGDLARIDPVQIVYDE